MKSKKNIHSRAGTRLVSIVSILAIAITALSFGFFNIGATGTAVPNADGTPNELGVRFVQLAAGEDFVIGLTYDGDLYGWSTKTSQTPTSTLGSYYRSYPTKINVRFITGPSGRSTQRYGWGNTAYHGTPGNIRAEEHIIQIAATRTTAAFVTSLGYIYTWGYDTPDVVHNNQTEHMLLLRDCSTADSQRANNNNEPYMINYGYYSDAANGATANLIPNTSKGLEQIIPELTGASTDMTDISIAGGEYNYSILFKRTAGSTYIYTWGSMLYDNAITTRQEAFRRYDDSESRENFLNDNGSVDRNIYTIPYSNPGKVVAGGYTTGINMPGNGGTRTAHTTSLMLRGRNFLTSKDATAAGGEGNHFTVTNTVRTPSPGEGYYYISSTTSADRGANNIRYSSNVYTYDLALIGARYVQISGNYTVASPNGQTEVKNNDLAYGRQVVGNSGGSDTGDGFDYAVESDVFEKFVYDSYGNKLNENVTDQIQIVPDAVSLGNDIGYGIYGGSLYSWGDNAYGQNGGGAGDGLSNRDIPTKVLTAVSNTNIFDVAAGKQLSGRFRAFYDNTTFDNSEEGLHFSENVKNDKNYITGILRSTNPTTKTESELWVWNNYKQDPVRLYYGGVTAASDVNYYNQFVKLYSGYGSKLFALTRLGQVVMIEFVPGPEGQEGEQGRYVQTIYDSFSNTPNGAAVNNWSVAAESENKAANNVSFTAGTEKDFEGSDLPDLGIYTITVNDAGVKEIDDGRYIVLNDNSGVYKGTRQSLVTENTIGNVYRIINPTADASIITVPTTSNGLENTTTGVPVDGLAVGGITISSFEPKFYWTADGATFNRANDLLTDDLVGIAPSPDGDGWTRVGNMFEYKFVNVTQSGTEAGDPNVTGISIKPLQSTKGGRIKIEFYIGRYATTGGSGTTGHASETQIFYDYKLCTFDFDVLNTPAYKHFEAFGATGNTANIPLLDPNNPFNRAFSVAVQDVSGGISKLIEQFFSEGPLLDPTLEGAIYQSIAESDSLGYPAASRITDGKLGYYLNETDRAKYNGKYQYLFSDRDADRITIRTTGGNNIASDGGGNAVTCAKDTVSVSVHMQTVTEQEVADKLLRDITYKFNNVYGLYDISITKSGDKYMLNFKFDIVRYTATGSTGTLAYRAENKVNDYITNEDAASNEWYTFSYDFNEYFMYGSNFKVDTGKDYDMYNSAGSSIAAVFSQPSLIATYDGTTYYGENDGTNKFTVSYANLAPTMVIGKVSEPLQIPLSRFVSTTGSYIMFSYADANNKYSQFNNQFPDETGTIDSVVTLTRNMITVTPMSTHSLVFTVAIQRFHTDDTTQTTFEDTENIFADGNEKIYIRFEFPEFKPFTFSWNPNATAPTLTSNGTIDLLGEDVNAVNAGTRFLTLEPGEDYRSRIYISQLQSSNTSVLTVQNIATPRNTTKFNFYTQGSGTTVVTFVLTLYGESKTCRINLNVSAITPITDEIELVDVSIIYVNTLLTELKRANAAFNEIENFTILYTDPANAVYFVNSEGEVEKPKWIGGVSFLDTDPALNNPRMRIEINENENDTRGNYTMYVRYVNKTAAYTTYAQAEEDGAPILETAQPIKSSRRVVPGEDGDSILTIRIDTDNLDDRRSTTGSEKGMWYAVGDGDDIEIRVPSAYLLKLLEDVSNVEEFEIFLVSAPMEASEYFSYGYSVARDYVTIRPIRNTPLDEFGVQQAITINVSVSSTLGTTDTRFIMSLRVTVTGISETLSKERYTTIWIVAFFSSFALLFIIYLIRMIVYWRARAKQRQIIKRNQELIKLRDRMHNKSTSATREQIVKSKLKMQDPKYAKMVHEMRQERQGAENGGVVVEGGMGMGAMGFGMTEPAPGMPGAAPAGKGKKDKKGKGGKKKSIAELKAELEAKKMAFAQAQQNPQAAPPPFGADVGAMPVDAQPMDAQPIDAQPFGAPGGFGADPFGAPGGFGADPFGAPQDIDATGIIFDAPDNGQM